MNSLAQLINEYQGQQACCLAEEMKTFQNREIKDAISKATRAENSKGEIHSHQIPNFCDFRKLPDQAESTLLRCADEIQRCKTFDDLHRLIISKLKPLHGAGPLYWYDTAFRIGISMSIYPQKVYLHAGTKKGAIALGIYRGKDVLEMSELPPELQQMDPYQVEDFLCIKRNAFHA